MKEVLREADLTRIGPYSQMLEAVGIRTFIRNENLSTFGNTGLWLFFPALCVVDDADYDRAVECIAEFEKGPPGDPDAVLRCAHCGEESPGTFGQCWCCNAPLDGPG